MKLNWEVLLQLVEIWTVAQAWVGMYLICAISVAATAADIFGNGGFLIVDK